jgi:glyoxylase-like metal-dependent hydrolase (beta-lactamase superfamily II)
MTMYSSSSLISKLMVVSFSIFASGSAISAVTITKDSQLATPQAGFYKMKVGGVEIVALSDGTFGFNAEDLLTHAKPGEVERLLKKAAIHPPVEANVNAFLIHLDDRYILIDSGTGELLGPKVNKLPLSLKNAGFSSDQITDVLLTHIHPDHSGGLSVKGQKVYPNATIHVARRELAYWTDKSEQAKATEPTKSFFAGVEPALGPYLQSGRVQTFEPPADIFPGLRALPAYGHTPGQSSFVLERNGQTMVFWGDIIHVPAVQFENPNITIKFDVDPALAATQRKSLFADAALNGWLVAMPHMYFPGVGHVQKEGTHYRFYPVPYVNDAQGSF